MSSLTDADNEQFIEEVKCETRKAMEKAGHSCTKIAKHLAKIAYADMKDYVTIDESGFVQAVPLDSLKSGRSVAIKRVKEKRTIRTERGTKDKPDGEQILDATYEFELHDKLDALKFSASLMGMVKPQKLKGELDLKNLKIVIHQDGAPE